MTKTILITGASGFTGMHACHYFSQRGYRVVGISRKRGSSTNWEMSTCDLQDKNDVEHIIKRYMPDFCLHLAGVNSVAQSWDDPLNTIEVNVIGTLNLLEAIRTIIPACKTIITGSALSGRNHPYAVSKQFQQMLSLDWGSLFNLPVIVAKPCNLIGPGHSNGFVSLLAKQIVKMEEIPRGETISVSHLENKREFLDVRDAVAAYEVLLLNGTNNTTYEIGSGQMNSLNDIALIYQSLIKKDLCFLSTNPTQDDPPDIMDTSKIRRLNWQPRFTLEESITHTLSYYRTSKD
jgi:nucleoside-diphosphate-sugar epimerase